MLSGRSLNLVDLVNGGGRWAEAELDRFNGWPKPLELPNIRDERYDG